MSGKIAIVTLNGLYLTTRRIGAANKWSPYKREALFMLPGTAAWYAERHNASVLIARTATPLQHAYVDAHDYWLTRSALTSND